ncbi:molybdenum cofactor biosynthesis protein MoaE [Maribellus comscasis]|uniref:Molybdopterin synthase catalytic subunit n=1 Tax=Maribellus comscasis TaxID=2681766 RepID=A0A6I6K0M3_9BACT|nr:molybdenum cofactor biosynthesis protein MoaE [Maribellus comscasis]QGY45962.1 molybdenum cofactor biosynthesis protein MoaE [Maribellus comscasis]
MKHLQHTDINYSELFDEFRHPNSGAVVLFSGEVRDNNKGREVTHLEYEAYEPMANKMIAGILEEAKSRFKLNQAACVHRLGKVEISGCAVVVITGAGHRKEAYDANRYIIDRVKNDVPIWKHEFFTDGTSEWGQNCDCMTDANETGHKHHHHEEA